MCPGYKTMLVLQLTNWILCLPKKADVHVQRWRGAFLVCSFWEKRLINNK